MQDTLAIQLDASVPHTPGQLASAGSLHLATLPGMPPPTAPRACALLATSMRTAHERAAADPATAVEVLFVCMHGLDALCAAYAAAAPRGLLPDKACNSIQQDLTAAGQVPLSRGAHGPTAQRLLATGRPQDVASAASALAELRHEEVDQCASASCAPARASLCDEAPHALRRHESM